MTQDIGMIKQGIYQHFKGGLYTVIACVKNDESDEVRVFYYPNYGENKFSSRTLENFTEEIERDGYKGKRFVFIQGLHVNILADYSEHGLVGLVQRLRDKILQLQSYNKMLERSSSLKGLDEIENNNALLRAENSKLRKAMIDDSNAVEQILGKALDYPWYKDDERTFPLATEEDGVCVGHYTVEDLAIQAAKLIKDLRNQINKDSK